MMLKMMRIKIIIQVKFLYRHEVVYQIPIVGRLILVFFYNQYADTRLDQYRSNPCASSVDGSNIEPYPNNDNNATNES